MTKIIAYVQTFHDNRTTIVDVSLCYGLLRHTIHNFCIILFHRMPFLSYLWCKLKIMKNVSYSQRKSDKGENYNKKDIKNDNVHKLKNVIILRHHLVM